MLGYCLVYCGEVLSLQSYNSCVSYFLETLRREGLHVKCATHIAISERIQHTHSCGISLCMSMLIRPCLFTAW